MVILLKIDIDMDIGINILNNTLISKTGIVVDLSSDIWHRRNLWPD